MRHLSEYIQTHVPHKYEIYNDFIIGKIFKRLDEYSMCQKSALKKTWSTQQIFSVKLDINVYKTRNKTATPHPIQN